VRPRRHALPQRAFGQDLIDQRCCALGHAPRSRISTCCREMLAAAARALRIPIDRDRRSRIGVSSDSDLLWPQFPNSRDRSEDRSSS